MSALAKIETANYLILMKKSCNYANRKAENLLKKYLTELLTIDNEH